MAVSLAESDWMSSYRCALSAVVGVAAFTGAGSVVGGEPPCRVLKVTLQPDCFRLAGVADCDPRRLDFGPQIATWLESVDGGRFETLLVTNLTAARGIGNRPGRWDFRSNPRWPYGRRQNALPIWAHRRGRLYDAVVMQDGLEDTLGFHEEISSPDPYYCRPLRPDEVIDAISCPTALFNSAKGRLDPAAPGVLYPPRSDLGAVYPRDCDHPVDGDCPTGEASAGRYAAINDLDAVAAATPPYGRAAQRTFPLPRSLVAGDYFVYVEVAKEFDGNQAHVHPSFEDPLLRGYGAADNFGQPSVVWRVPLRIDDEAHDTSAATILGYSDWDGATGDIHPPDATISDGPGSGQGRLLVLPGGDGARVRVRVEGCGDGCTPAPPRPGPVQGLSVPHAGLDATSAEITFLHANDGGSAVRSYDLRYRAGQPLSDADFADATPGPDVPPGAPGTPASVRLDGLKPQTTYSVGIRARGICMGDSSLAEISFTTPAQKFTQLSGCFIATAAFGSSLHPAVAGLRPMRDHVRDGSAPGAALVAIYERSSPPVASVLVRSDAVRAVVRAGLGPLLTSAAP